MKKIITLFIAIFAVMVIVGCASKPKLKTQILEEKGTRWGVERPKWVETILSTPNQKTLSKALGIDKHIWVLSSDGEDLEFVQNYVDQVSARAEIAASIEQIIADSVKADFKGGGEDANEKSLNRDSARGAMVNLVGLNKEIDWWTKTRSRLDRKSDYEIKYNYLVVYSLEEDLYQKQIRQAIDNFGIKETSIEMIFEKLNDLAVIKVQPK